MPTNFVKGDLLHEAAEGAGPRALVFPADCSGAMDQGIAVAIRQRWPAFAAAFAMAQDQLRPLPAMSAEEWAALSSERASDPAGALARRQLRDADLARLSRHFARALTDRAVAKRYFDAYYRAQRQAR